MATSAPFQSLQLERYPRIKDALTSENRYWKQFRQPKEIKCTAPVTSIDFCQTAPHDYAVTCATRIHVYNSETKSVKKTFSRFQNTVYSATFRQDGKLIVAGGHDSRVKVLDVGTKSLLRDFKGHTGPVRAAKFSSDNIHVVSGSDDKSLRYWDVPSEKPVSILSKHSDYVRCLAADPNSANIWASGSYDHTVKLWDLRSGSEDSANTLTVNHGHPVESCMYLPGGSLLLSTGSNVIKVWDVLGGGRLLHTFSNHQKTITSVCVDGTKTRLLSASLDGHVKIYDLKTYEVTHGFKADSGGILSVGLSPSNSQLVMGTTESSLIIRQRSLKETDIEQGRQSTQILKGGTTKFFLRGKNVKAMEGDSVVQVHHHKRIAPYDKSLRKFKYRESLDKALETRSPVIVISMLKELKLRMGLKRALSNRDEATLEPLLSFLITYIIDPRFTCLLIEVSHVLCDLYLTEIGKSIVIDDLFMKLHTKIQHELKLHENVLGLIGTMDTIMTAQACNSHK